MKVTISRKYLLLIMDLAHFLNWIADVEVYIWTFKFCKVLQQQI